jgi:hypothetical protein
MRLLLISLTVLLLCVLPAEGQPASGLPGGGGGSVDVEGPCRTAPAACLGALTPLPVAGSAGSTQPDAGCRTGRIVTPDAGGQSDALPWCPDTDGDGVADPPAPPPSHAEITAALCPAPPAPAIGTNPHAHSITGLATWLWDDSDPAASTTHGSIRGHPVSCTLTPSRWTFDTGDPHAARYGHPTRHTATAPGEESETTPTQHTYEVTGTYTIALTVTWDRTTTAGADRPTATTSRDHQVKQVRTGATTGD